MRLIAKAVPFVLCLVSNPCGAAKPLSLDFRLTPLSAGPGPFGAPSSGDLILRLYPGEPMEVDVSARVYGATVSEFDNSHQLPHLTWCLLAGADHADVINAGGALSCLGGTGVGWSTTSLDDGSSPFHITATSTGTALPAGDYTLIALLDTPELQTLFGNRANIELRSSQVHIIAGPAADEDEQLSQLLRHGRRAADAEDWATALSSATAVLNLYPQSVLALALRGDAYLGSEQLPEAHTAYQEALSMLQSNQDTRTPSLAKGQVARAWAEQLEHSLQASE